MDVDVGHEMTANKKAQTLCAGRAL
jgi:hypothetical protein